MDRIRTKDKQSGKRGWLARQWCGMDLELRVLKSEAGYYLGTADESGPVSRESDEYWPSCEEAETALDRDAWTQRPAP